MTRATDETDLRILSILQTDASQSVDALADQVDLSRNACWRRIKRLEAEGILLKRVGIVDPEAVGLGLAAFVFLRGANHDLDKLAQFREAIADMPEIVGAHRMSGEYDVILKVRVADMPAYDRFYQRLVSKVPVTDIHASFVMEDITDTTALPL